jgi:hypothetical protein
MKRVDFGGTDATLLNNIGEISGPVNICLKKCFWQINEENPDLIKEIICMD